MPTPATYNFARYLAAKKSVDDRALNGHVRQRLMQAIPGATAAEPLRVLEVGAGIGTMVERLVAWGALTHAVYTAIDADPELVAESQRRLPRWMAAQGFEMTAETPARQCFRRQGHTVVVETEAIDVQDFIPQVQGQRVWDLLIAHHFLDIIDGSITLPGLLSLLRSGGLFYGTLVFDGATILQPDLDPALDADIEALYHQSMERQTIAGSAAEGSRAGRRLFEHLRKAGLEILAAGSSDWVVFAGPQGYPDDEAFFLHCIVHTMATALQGHPQLDQERFAAWIARRHAQVDQGALVYIAHQLDFLGRVPPPTIKAKPSLRAGWPCV
jgi:SAM-dependent methyltransferase